MRWGWGVHAAIALTLAVGLAIGAWHGLWVAYARLPAFVVTLTSMLAFRGLLVGITRGDSIAIEHAPQRAAQLFQMVGQGYLPTFRPTPEGAIHDTSLVDALAFVLGYVAFTLRGAAARRRYALPVPSAAVQALKLLLASGAALGVAGIMVTHRGIPWSVLVVLALAVAYAFIARGTMFGRHIFAIGGNLDAARLSGINVKRNTVFLFMSMGAMTALASIVYTSRLNAATPSAGMNAEMDAVAAAVLGGTSLAGGVGSIPGAVVGALVMGSVDNGHEPDEPRCHVPVRDQGAHRAARGVDGRALAPSDVSGDRACSGVPAPTCRRAGAICSSVKGRRGTR